MSAAPSPLLSILIPAYNRPDMLSELLASLRSVTVDCEILVVDDASPQDLKPAVEAHASLDARISCKRNAANLGPTANFNNAIALSTGRYFCILGDDDSVLPGNFEKKLAVLEAHPEIGLIYSRHFYTDADNRNPHLAVWQGMLPYSYIGGRDEFSDLFPWNYISLHSVVYRRELWERYGGFDEQVTECGNDWDLNLRYCYHTETAYIDEPLLNVRLHEGTTTVQRGFRDHKLANGRMEVWRKWLVQTSPPLVLDDRGWNQVREHFKFDLNHWFAKDAEKVEPWLREFDRMRVESEAKANECFETAAGR